VRRCLFFGRAGCFRLWVIMLSGLAFFPNSLRKQPVQNGEVDMLKLEFPAVILEVLS
jgi:hypothetical protein